MPLYDLHQLGWHNFQQLCLTISREVLGQTVQSFLDSRDGGRDGAFVGTWEARNGEDLRGRFVIQCKFTSKVDRALKLSDVEDELAKAKRLAQRNRCDCYLLLTNFGISGIRDEKIEDAFLSVGIKQFRCYGADWICQLIRDKSRLRMLVPRVYGLGDLSQILDERAYDQARTVLDAMREDLSKVVLTGAYQSAVTALDEHGFVLLLGEPACGKTTIAGMMAMAAVDQWKASTLKLETSHEMIARWNPHEPKQFFWIDDAFGVAQYELSLALDWNRIFPKVRAMMKAGARIVLTSRDYIYRRAKRDLKESAFPLMHESQVVIDVRNITTEERRQILYNHIKLGDQPVNFRRKTKPFLGKIAAHPRFSPEMARRLGNSQFTRDLRISETNLMNFVERQEQLLQDIISSLDKYSRAALGLIFMRSDALESPVEIHDSEASALARLGSNLGETITALQAMQGSLTVHVKEAGRALWRFKHPTVGDAYGRILLTDPELMDVYIQGAPTEELLDTITCGDLGLEGAVVIPRSLYNLMMEKLSEFNNPRSFDKSQAWTRQCDTEMFLARRCDRNFLDQYLKIDPGPLQRLSETSFYLASSKVNLALRLFAFGLLPEEHRKKFVKIVTECTIEGSDSDFFENKELRKVFTADEQENLMNRCRTELIPKLADARVLWECKHSGDDDPGSHMDPFFIILAGLEEELGSNAAMLKAIDSERDRAFEWISETEDRLNEQAAAKFEEEFSNYNPPQQPHQRATERDIFDDIDV